MDRPFEEKLIYIGEKDLYDNKRKFNGRGNFDNYTLNNKSDKAKQCQYSIIKAGRIE